MSVARVVVDIPTRSITKPFDYAVPDRFDQVAVGSCVAVEFGSRPAIGYVIEVIEEPAADTLKPISAVLAGPYFDAGAARVAQWISDQYLCPLSEALLLFTPPGGTPRIARQVDDAGVSTYSLVRAGVSAVDDRWVALVPGADFRPRGSAIKQIAILSMLSEGPVRLAELAADLGSVHAAVSALEKAGAVTVEHRRRFRESVVGERVAHRHERLTPGQSAALAAIEGALGRTSTFLVDGVTGSGKTELYLRAIETTLSQGRGAIVLVPEISLTPQTVGRFRSRFGDQVAVLHSRLSQGERFDQWDLVREGAARIVVGARSALFAPVRDLGLIVIDEEHESSYKQGSSPRYHARDVAQSLAHEHQAVLLLGSASPSMESQHRCDSGEWTRLVLPERATGGTLPPVSIVDMAAEFEAGHRSMFSRELSQALLDVRDAGRKAVLFLNRRGAASFLLCRECGHVPMCDSCATSMTYHEVGGRLMCHHCGATRRVPATCPSCQSPYLRQFGAGTQRVETELRSLLGDWPLVRMDADSTKGKGAHERLLTQFETLESGVLLGTQMIAKGLDYPEVTLVGVIAADITLNVPDFRAGERTYQLLEQVSGRAGRGDEPGRVVIQTYWPQHPAIVAASLHDPEVFYTAERAARRDLSYPPYSRLANVMFRGRDKAKVADVGHSVTAAIQSSLPDGWSVLGPSPSALSRVKGVWRWHTLVKAPHDSDIAAVLSAPTASASSQTDVTVAVDIDPVDLL